MAAWIGLAGVVAGALIAFCGQYFLRRTERQERNDSLLLEQFALVIAMSEDYRNRVWAERQGATGVVSEWDLGAYRLAEARIRLLSRDRNVNTALEALRESGKQLGKAWMLAPRDAAAVDRSWKEYRTAINQFVDVSSQMLRR